MKEKYPTFHQQLSRFDGHVALLPYGVYINNTLPKLKPGDTVAFTGDRRRLHRINVISRLKIESRDFVMWLKVVYGDRGTVKQLLNKWEIYSIVMGFGSDGFSRDECWLLVTEPVE